MKRILQVVAICTAFVMMASFAFATEITPVTVNTPDGAVVIGQMDWAPGSGLTVDGNVFGPGGSTNPLEFLYQAFMSVFLDPTPAQLAVNTPNLNTDNVGDGINPYEFTVTADIFEIATGLGGGVAAFTLSANAANQITVYFDTTPDADVAAGTGFNDGLSVITAVPISLTSVFFQTDTNGNGVLDNQDTGVGGTDLVSVITSVDASIFPTLAVGSLWVSHFIGTQNTPPEGVNTVLMFDGTVPDYFTGLADGTTPFNTEDLLLKVDGNTHFTPVPEPGTIILLGTGLIGLAFSAIRRKSSK